MIDTAALTQIIGIVRRAGKVQPSVTIAPESRLVEDLNIDSLDLVDIILKIQDQFDVVIDDDDVPNLRRVSDLAAYVSARRGKAVA